MADLEHHEYTPNNHAHNIINIARVQQLTSWHSYFLTLMIKLFQLMLTNAYNSLIYVHKKIVST